MFTAINAIGGIAVIVTASMGEFAVADVSVQLLIAYNTWSIARLIYE